MTKLPLLLSEEDLKDSTIYDIFTYFIYLQGRIQYARDEATPDNSEYDSLRLDDEEYNILLGYINLIAVEYDWQSFIPHLKISIIPKSNKPLSRLAEEDLRRLLKGREAIPNHPYFRKRITATGTFPTSRNWFNLLFPSYGIFYSETITKQTDYLLVGEKGDVTAKYVKAKKLNIPIIAWEDIVPLLRLPEIPSE